MSRPRPHFVHCEPLAWQICARFPLMRPLPPGKASPGLVGPREDVTMTSTHAVKQTDKFDNWRRKRCQLGQLKALSVWKDVSLVAPTIARLTNSVIHRHHLIARVTNVTHGTCDTPVPTVGCTYSLRRRKCVSCRGPLETRSGRWRSYRYREIRTPKYATWRTCDSLFVGTGQPAYAIGRERYGLGHDLL